RAVSLRGSEIESLKHHGPVAVPVVVDQQLPRIALDPILRVTGEKALQEMRLVEVEHPPVVGLVYTSGSVEKPQRVVAELLPYLRALADRNEVHSGTRGGGL